MYKTLVIVALIVLGARPVLGQWIGVFVQPDHFAYCGFIRANAPTPLYVLYVGWAGPRATGAEYAIVGMHGQFGVDYLASLVSAPGSNINLGNAFDGGHNVAWPVGQPFDRDGYLLLATWCVTLLSSQSLEPTTLEVLHREPPSNASFRCPLVVTEGFSLSCVQGGQMYLNDPRGYCWDFASEPRASGPSPCVVAVEKQTWSGVRRLYR